MRFIQYLSGREYEKRFNDKMTRILRGKSKNILNALGLFVPILLFILAGCAVEKESPPVKLAYMGNSCIMITSPDGTRIVSDPYQPNSKPAGLSELPADLTADAVTISHTHPDHNNYKAVGGDPQVLRDPGTYQIGEVKVTGYLGWEGSPEGPDLSRRNVIFVYETNDVKIVQLGDSGIVTDPEVLSAIEDADIVIVNIDGYVIQEDRVMTFMQQIKAHTVMLAHYSLEGQAPWNDAPTAKAFVIRYTSGVTVLKTGSEMDVTPDMPEQIAILTPSTLIIE
jgi:L-ascorbate metabolism protein UlaG (beta-lactamase superfamily)